MFEHTHTHARAHIHTQTHVPFHIIKNLLISEGKIIFA